LPQISYMVYSLYVFTIIALAILGAVSAKTGGANIRKGVFRIVILGTMAMGLSALVGYIFGVNI